MNKEQQPLPGDNESESDNTNTENKNTTYQQSGDLGIGNMSNSKIDGKSKIASKIEEGSYNTYAEEINHIYCLSHIETSQQLPTLSNAINIAQEFKQQLEVKSYEIKHQYAGQIVAIEFKLFAKQKFSNDQKILVNLHIAFNEVNEKISYDSGSPGNKKEVNVRFGIKYGSLGLTLSKCVMPLSNRESLKKIIDWQVTTIGAEQNPIWVFETQGEQLVLKGHGSIFLGIANLLSDACVIKAIFKISIVENDIVITSQDGLWNSQTKPSVRETKKRVFLKKVLKSKLGEYLNELELQYDSAITS